MACGLSLSKPVKKKLVKGERNGQRSVGTEVRPRTVKRALGMDARGATEPCALTWLISCLGIFP